jgi:hypothetical protein
MGQHQTFWRVVSQTARIPETTPTISKGLMGMLRISGPA